MNHNNHGPTQNNINHNGSQKTIFINHKDLNNSASPLSSSSRSPEQNLKTEKDDNLERQTILKRESISPNVKIEKFNDSLKDTENTEVHEYNENSDVKAPIKHSLVDLFKISDNKAVNFGLLGRSTNPAISQPPTSTQSSIMEFQLAMSLFQQQATNLFAKVNFLKAFDISKNFFFI